MLNDIQDPYELTAFRIVGRIIGRRLKSQEVIFNVLLPIAEERCRERDLKAAGQAVPHHVRALCLIRHLGGHHRRPRLR